MCTRAAAALIGAVSLWGCSARPSSPAAPISPSRALYEVHIASDNPWIIDVEATFEGGVETGAIAFPPGALGLSVYDNLGKRTPREHGRSFLLHCRGTCRVHYQFNLTAAAELTHDAASVAVRSEGDLVAPASTWFLRPEPVNPHTPVELNVDTSQVGREARRSVRFEAPFPRDSRGHYQLVARDLSALGYTLWGSFVTRDVPVTSGRLQLALTAGSRAVTDESIVKWVGRTARALDTVYGRFPIDQALLTIVPVQGSNVVEFGRTVPAGGASILLFVGADADASTLANDWILAHELVHLGVPSMPRDGRWLDEGLATYYEPVLRARAGLSSPAEVWASLVDHAEKGAATRAEPSLAATEEHDRVYFGGAAFCLAADVEIRSKTSSKRSLDDGLKRALARGANATRVWTVDEFVDVLDDGVGQAVVRPMLDRIRRAKIPCNAADPERCAPDETPSLARLFASLGVKPGRPGEVTFDDGAPLAKIRRELLMVDVAAANEIAKD
ncbi:MAG: hypothetical protein IPK82_41205 [Polyangiaceae bacterium]|nr:hypothetical protein [Polyangiaceae bacterium]